MSVTIYAIVNHEGYIAAFVNAQLVPEIALRPDAVLAPKEEEVLREGKVWRWRGNAWAQVPDPRGLLSHHLQASARAQGWAQWPGPTGRP